MKLKEVYFYISYPVLAFIVYSIIVSIIEITLHQDAFGIANVKVFVMTASCFVLVAFSRYKLVRDERELGGWNKTMISTIVCTIAMLLINIIAGVFRTFQVISLEIFMFYVNIAIAEELLYRVLLVNIVTFLLNFSRYLKRNTTIKNIIIILVSGCTFSLAHLNVYYLVPEMMLATCIGGCLLAGFYIYTRNPFVIIPPHVVVNLLATGCTMLNSVILLM